MTSLAETAPSARTRFLQSRRHRAMGFGLTAVAAAWCWAPSTGPVGCGRPAAALDDWMALQEPELKIAMLYRLGDAG